MENDPRGAGNHPRLHFRVEVSPIDHSWWVFMVFLESCEHKLWFGVLGDLRGVWLGFVGGFDALYLFICLGLPIGLGIWKLGKIWVEKPIFRSLRLKVATWGLVKSRPDTLGILGFGHRSRPVIGHVATYTLRSASGFVWPWFEVVRPRGARGSSEGPFLGYCGVYLRRLSW